MDKNILKNNYTNKAYWENYWNNYTHIPVKRFFYEDLIKDWPSGNKKIIEIGGFPGNNTAFFAKVKNYDTTLLDYIIIPEIISKVEKTNSLINGTIKFIEADFFSYKPSELYDIVFSQGFIEHFEDTEDIIRRHLNFLKPGGKLLITLPNFTGLNGLIQYIFHKENLQRHNLQCMKLGYLINVSKPLPINNLKVFYYGKPQIWLEQSANINRYVRNILFFFAKFLRRIPIHNNRFFSPHIVLLANKTK